jgi:hypothetical protein
LSLPPVVETDASDYTIAGILTLSGAELHYDTHDKDLLVIFEAFKTWRHYLESRGKFSGTGKGLIDAALTYKRKTISNM